MKYAFYIFSIIFCLAVKHSPQDLQHPAGSLSGTVLDNATKSPLLGATVVVLSTQNGSATDINGTFSIKSLNAGSYTLQISYIGYETKKIPDVLIKPGRVNNYVFELSPSSLQLNQVNITSGYFGRNKSLEQNVTGFSYEEIRRAPGAFGDISRIIGSLPSIAKTDDQKNSLIVRGGSPNENGFYLDNIEIPNINHFPTQGSSGGAISLINVDFVDNISFSAGGFSAAYGDRLSAIMDINFREPNFKQYNTQFDLNFSGAGIVFEGPLSENSALLFSAKRSYLDLLIKAFDTGTSIAPLYSDYQAKLVYNLSPSNKLSFLFVSGDDHSSSDLEAAKENDMTYFGEQDIYNYTGGFNLRTLWGKSGFSNTSVSYNSSFFREFFNETASRKPLFNNNSLENSLRFRNGNTLYLNSDIKFDVGFEGKYYYIKYANKLEESIDPLGNTTPAVANNLTSESYKAGGYFIYTHTLFSSLDFSAGVRSDYSSLTKRNNLQPRGSITYRLDNLTSIGFAAGMYSQTLPFPLLLQNDDMKKLKDTRAVHYNFTVSRLLSEDTKMTIELYRKDYTNFPVDPTQPDLFIIDETQYSNGFYAGHTKLLDNGKAYSQGIELVLQKKLADGLYGMISASYSDTKYKTMNGNRKSRVYDNRVIFNAEGGYKLNDEWEFSAKWVYAGGIPYTPFNITESTLQNRGIFDYTRINGERHPAYHSMNIRVDKRFYFDNSSLIVYLSIWNVYARENIASYFWNSIENKPDRINQWSLLPIFGIEYEL